MCGRYTIRKLELMRAAFEAKLDTDLEDLKRQINLFNVAPSQHCPIVRINSSGERVLSLAKWGLIPSWTRGKPKMQPINAKSETAATSGMFRQALERRRCLIPVDGFYEWQGSKPQKQPYFIHRKDDGMFAFAGLWERWRADENSEPIDTFTILTTEPNELMRPIHNRMPVILDQSALDRWLNRDNKASDVADLLKAFDAKQMEAWPVSTRVNTPANNDPSLIEHIK
jgi:putative SOS response-associated peptidase YedK